MWCATRNILGAITITIFTNDHPFCLNQARLRIYTDDTTLHLSAASTEDSSRALDRKL